MPNLNRPKGFACRCQAGLCCQKQHKPFNLHHFRPCFLTALSRNYCLNFPHIKRYAYPQKQIAYLSYPFLFAFTNSFPNIYLLSHRYTQYPVLRHAAQCRKTFFVALIESSSLTFLSADLSWCRSLHGAPYQRTRSPSQFHTTHR